MVGAGRREAGKARLGCLVTLLLVVSVAYLFRDLPGMYLKYYQMQDEVQSQANFAPSLSNESILQRLVARADTLDIPLGPKQWFIKRDAQGIVIRGEYEDSVVVGVLGWRRVIHFHFTPHASAEL